MKFWTRHIYFWYKCLTGDAGIPPSGREYYKTFAVWRNFKIRGGNRRLITYIPTALEEIELIIKYENQFCYNVQPTLVVREIDVYTNFSLLAPIQYSLSKMIEIDTSVSASLLEPIQHSLSLSGLSKSINVEVRSE